MKKSTFLRSLLTLLVMAVWGTSAMAQTITDELTLSTFGVSGTTYKSVTGKKSNSDAVYSAQMAGGNNAIQLRSKNSNSGIVTTASGGNVKSITITWNSNTSSARKIDVYGKKTAFTAPTELYNTASEVTKLGTLSYSATANTLEISGDYQYIGIRSNDGALYLDKVEIVWNTAAATSCTAPTFTPDGGTVEKGSTVSLACGTEGATIYYAINAADPETAVGTAYTTPIDINEDCSITAWAEADGMDASARITKEFTAATYIDFQKANNVVSGQKYLIFADNKIGIPHTSNYGYLEVTAATPTEEVIKQFGETNAFTFTAVEGGYTIQDSNNKYYYQSGTYNNFNVSETLPEDGSGVWSVEPQSDGTFKITNNLTNKYIQYTTFGNYGSYADLQASAILPTLYTNGVDLGTAVTKQEQTLIFSGTEFSVNENETFTSPTLTGAETTVSYSSSNEEVATVDASTGKVTIVGVGFTTITATAESSEEYYEGTASYTLTVLEVLAANVIWKEDFSSNSVDGYTIEDGGGTTKLYNEALAGGEAPEILIAKSGGSLTVSNLDLKGYSGTFLLTFNSNNGISEITSTTTGVKVNKIDFTKPNGVYEVYVPEGTTSLDLTLTNTTGKNTRVDNILLEHKYDLQTLNISSVGYATFCTDKNFIMSEGVEGGIVTVDETAANVNYAYAYKDNIFASDIVPAGTGLLMKGAQGEYKMYATTQEATEVYAENLLKGALTNEEITAPAGSLLYIFAKDSDSGLGFYWQNDSGNGQRVQNMAGKAYLQVPTTSAVKGFRLNLGDTTGITAVETTNGNAPIYTLSGVRVNGSLNNLPAGIYIVGGKKVYVK